MIPKGKRLKQNLPNGVTKVFSSKDSGESFTCQKPELASNFVKIFASPICASICSTDGKMCLSRCTLLFSLVKLMQILTFPLAFGLTTILKHQLVGCSTFSITPKFCICSNPAYTFGKIGMIICLGVVRAYGSESLCSLIQ